MKSKIALFIYVIFIKKVLADIPANNNYRIIDPDVPGFNYLPGVLVGLLALGVLIFMYSYKKEKSAK